MEKISYDRVLKKIPKTMILEEQELIVIVQKTWIWFANKCCKRKTESLSGNRRIMIRWDFIQAWKPVLPLNPPLQQKPQKHRNTINSCDCSIKLEKLNIWINISILPENCKSFWHMKVTIVRIIIGAHETVWNTFLKVLDKIEVWGKQGFCPMAL